MAALAGRLSTYSPFMCRGRSSGSCRWATRYFRTCRRVSIEGIDGRDTTLEMPAPAVAADDVEELDNGASHCAHFAAASAYDDYCVVIAPSVPGKVQLVTSVTSVTSVTRSPEQSEKKKGAPQISFIDVESVATLGNAPTAAIHEMTAEADARYDAGTAAASVPRHDRQRQAKELDVQSKICCQWN